MKDPKTKFIIYGSARTGTTICGSLLSNHKDLVVDHEILNLHHAVSKKDWNDIYKKIGFGYVPPLHFRNISIENLATYRCHQLGDKYYSFKLLSGHLDKEAEKQFIERRVKAGWKIIHLVRKNILETAVSFYIASENDDKSNNTWFGEKSKVCTIESGKLMELLERFEIEQQAQLETLKHLPHLKLVYEEDFLNAEKHQDSSDRIFDHLKMSRCPVASTLQKQSQRKLSDRMQNWEEIQSVIKNSRFEKYLPN